MTGCYDDGDDECFVPPFHGPASFVLGGVQVCDVVNPGVRTPCFVCAADMIKLLLVGAGLFFPINCVSIMQVWGGAFIDNARPPTHHFILAMSFFVECSFSWREMKCTNFCGCMARCTLYDTILE